MPEGLDRKYPKAGVSWELQWLFPSREASIEPVSGVLRRHHVLDGVFQNFIRPAARAAGINKRVFKTAAQRAQRNEPSLAFA